MGSRRALERGHFLDQLGHDAGQGLRMRLLFTTTRGLGHVLSVLPFARAARDAGHEVVLAGPAPVAAVTAGAGLDYGELVWPDEESLAVARRRVAELDGVEKVRAAIGDLFVTAFGGAALSSTLALVERWRPDVIVHETAEASAPIAGELHRVPTVRVSVALATRSEAWWLSLAGPALDGLRERVGVAADLGAERLSRTPLLTCAPSALDVGEGDPPPDVRRFRHEGDGDAAALRAWWPFWAADAPLVPISFGTVVPIDGHYPGVYRDAIDAVAGLPVRILVTVGRDADPAALGPLPPNVHVERWVAIAAVLRDAAALVTHGGTGTTLAALAAGVPMALLPIPPTSRATPGSSPSSAPASRSSPGRPTPRAWATPCPHCSTMTATPTSRSASPPRSASCRRSPRRSNSWKTSRDPRASPLPNRHDDELASATPKACDPLSASRTLPACRRRCRSSSDLERSSGHSVVLSVTTLLSLTSFGDLDHGSFSPAGSPVRPRQRFCRRPRRTARLVRRWARIRHPRRAGGAA
jgi:UDP:flavonoid glycosyltransferase YjiC (YdhE family)